MVFPDADYDKNAFSQHGNTFVFNHSAFGADMFRYSADFAQNWTTWQNWEDQTTINMSFFSQPNQFWAGHHIIMQCGSTFMLCVN
jgi:alpha-1,3-glucan synthase